MAGVRIVLEPAGSSSIRLDDLDDLGAFSVAAAGSDDDIARVLESLGDGGHADADGHVVVRIDAVRRLAGDRADHDWNRRFDGMVDDAAKSGWITEDGSSIVAHIDRDPAALIPSISLNSGRTIPQLGFGVFRVPVDETERLVSEALEQGYRHLDTAAVYRNEAEVGRAIAASGISRGDLFVTTKVFNQDQGADKTPAAFDKSLSALGLDYVDLYLIHWPAPRFDLYVQTWHVLEQLSRAGLTHSIGVSNFLTHHLERLLARAEIVPAVNQIELHPILQQAGVVEFCHTRGIAIEAWSPLGAGQLPLFTAAPVVAAAETHDRTPAQIVLRWHIQLGNIVFPKSSSSLRMRENMAIFDFALSEGEMAAISALERGGRVGFHPDEWH